jgi:hypothetical protein
VTQNETSSWRSKEDLVTEPLADPFEQSLLAAGLRVGAQAGELRTTVLGSRFDHRAQCECGYVGRRHLFRGSAVMDALIHSQQTAHPPANPLAPRKSAPPL